MKEVAALTDAFRTRFKFDMDVDSWHWEWLGIDKVPESFPDIIRAIHTRNLRVFFGEGSQFEPGSFWNAAEWIEQYGYQSKLQWNEEYRRLGRQPLLTPDNEIEDLLLFGGHPLPDGSEADDLYPDLDSDPDEKDVSDD